MVEPSPPSVMLPTTPELRRFLGRLPPAIAARLSDSDLAAYAEALTPQRAPHWIDVRASLPIPGIGIYVALMVGRERRARQRLVQEGQLGLASTLMVAVLFVSTLLTGGIAALFLIRAITTLAGDGGDLWWHAHGLNF